GRALAKSPADRYPSMEELRRDLLVIHRELVGASARYPVTQILPDTVRTPRSPAADDDQTLATPSSGVSPLNITPPSVPPAGIPAAAAADATPTPGTPGSGGVRPALELVNSRDPSSESLAGGAPAPGATAGGPEPRFTAETTGAVRRTRLTILAAL